MQAPHHRREREMEDVCKKKYERVKEGESLREKGGRMGERGRMREYERERGGEGGERDGEGG